MGKWICEFLFLSFNYAATKQQQLVIYILFYKQFIRTNKSVKAKPRKHKNTRPPPMFFSV